MLIPCSETDLLTSSIHLRGISSLDSQPISCLLIFVQREAGATKGVPRCLVVYPPNCILKILEKKQESCYMGCDVGTPPHSDGIICWIAKLESSPRGLPTPST